MSDTTNSSADPWGLPESDPIPVPDSSRDGDEKEPVPAESAEPDADSPEVPGPPVVEVEFGSEVEMPSELDDTEDIDDVPPPPPAESRGPLSEVLAASGLFGGTPAPAAAQPPEPDEPEEIPETIGRDELGDQSIDITPLEAELEDDQSEPPGLSEPTATSSLGVGATDADLPVEPPPWMIAAQAPADQDEATDGLHGLAVEEVAPDGVAAVLDEAAAAFGEVKGTDDDHELPVEIDQPIEIIEEPAVPDTEFESLVAELADTALEIDDEAEAEETVSDISFDPDDTPSVFRELEDLAGSEPATDIPDLEDAIVSIEDVTEAVEETAAGDEVDDISEPVVDRTEAEWGVFELSDEPSEPDAPVFGVTFGREDTLDATEEVTEAPAVDAEDALAALPNEDGEDIEEPIAEVLAELAVADEVEDYETPELPPVASLDATDRDDLEGQEAEQLASLSGDLYSAGEPSVLPDPEPTEIETTAQPEEPAKLDEVETAPSTVAETPQPDDFAPESVFVETLPEPEPDNAVPIEWGSRWQESAQGWVEDDQGRSTWRPIVTTSPLLSEWQIDTYLGVVAADVVLGSGSIESEMVSGRQAAMRSMVDEAMARGAHAIVGVATTLAPVGRATVLTATGTAVTLKAQD